MTGTGVTGSRGVLGGIVTQLTYCRKSRRLNAGPSPAGRFRAIVADGVAHHFG